MIAIQTRMHTQLLPTRNGYIVDGRIAWWKVQTRSHAIVLTVTGELDASNTDRFDRCVHDLISVGDPFVIDIRDVSFVGVQCFQTLLEVGASCRAAGRPWALVTHNALRPLTDIDDRSDVLPVAGSLADALRVVADARSNVFPLTRVRRTR